MRSLGEPRMPPILMWYGHGLRREESRLTSAHAHQSRDRRHVYRVQRSVEVADARLDGVLLLLAEEVRRDFQVHRDQPVVILADDILAGDEAAQVRAHQGIDLVGVLRLRADRCGRGRFLRDGHGGVAWMWPS